MGEKAAVRKKRKEEGDERDARARAHPWYRRKRENSELNIKLHFAIGSSQRKRRDPTHRNSAVATKKGSLKGSYFSGIKLFTVRIALNITSYFRQNCSVTCYEIKNFRGNFFSVTGCKTAYNLEINIKRNADPNVENYRLAISERDLRNSLSGNSVLHGERK